MQSAMSRLCDVKSEVSAHYVIDEDGSTFALVDETKRAWHAGKSFWRGVTDLNSASIGIELVNPGHEWGYHAFPEVQISALLRLLPKIILRHKLNAAQCLLAHSDIAVARRTDPGELFPWHDLANEGFGIWPMATDYSPLQREDEVKFILSEIGYDTTSPQQALLAFQRRFHRENLSGFINDESLARLRSIKTLWDA